MSPSFLESGQLDEMLANIQGSSKRSKSRENPNGGLSQTQAIQERGNSGSRSIFNMTQKPSKSVDLTSNNVGGNGKETGLPENDDEILSQLNQMT